MSDDLIEKIARAIARSDGSSDDNWQHWLPDARAALSAIEAEGPTTEALKSAIKETEYKYFGDYPLSDGQWDAITTLCLAARTLLSARPPLPEGENT